MIRTPWNPPELAETFSLRRQTADGGWEPCTAEYFGGDVRARHTCKGTTRAIFVACWGGGTYGATFHKADGKAAGGCTVRLKLPPRPAAATPETMGEVNESDDGADDEEVLLHGAPVDADELELAQDDGEETEAEQLRRELAEVRAELAKAKRAAGESLRALPPRKPAPVAAAPVAERVATLGLSGEAGRELALYFHLQQLAVSEADARIEKWEAREASRRADDDARHRRQMEEVEARHQRLLDVERAATERAAKPRDQYVAELRARIADLESTPEPAVAANPVEAAVASVLPQVVSTLAELLKSRAVGAVAAALPAATG